jgi:hypothetical protein
VAREREAEGAARCEEPAGPDPRVAERGQPRKTRAGGRQDLCP